MEQGTGSTGMVESENMLNDAADWKFSCWFAGWAYRDEMVRSNWSLLLLLARKPESFLELVGKITTNVEHAPV